MKQNNEQIKTWNEVKNNKHFEYHLRQYDRPYSSTVAFINWLEETGLLVAGQSQNILDAGCGAGANVYHMARRHPESRFAGFDINPDLAAVGNEKLAALSVANTELTVGDIYNPEPALRGQFDGVVCLQTLSWLPSFREPMQALAGLGAKWIAASSLFFEGNIDATIKTKDYTIATAAQEYEEQFYNVYSLSQAGKAMAAMGYDDFIYKRFDIDIDLAPPTDGGFGTYTEKLANGRRLQISGPLLMSWYFIAAKRRDAVSAASE